MLIWLWAYLRGYVAVEVTGTSVERFLNLASHRGIYIWDVTPLKGGVQIHCSIRGFKMLRDCLRKTKCRIKITGREGFPFLIHRYRKRKVLMGGAAFFVLSLYIMSSFIWRIDIEGNERVAADELLKFSRERGLHIGAFKYFLDHRELARQLLFEFPDIGWADVHTRGTRTTIIISETIAEPPPERARHIPRDIPCNIVAARDGLITSIVTAAGMPKVRQNDVVREGDLLVSGALPVETEHTGQSTTIFVHAYAEVWAKMYTPIQFSIPMSYTYKVFTGNERRHNSISFLIGSQFRNSDPFSINLFHGRISFDNYDKIVSYIQPGASGNYPLPLILTQERYREFIPETRQRSVEEAIALAERVITERIIREMDFHADIIDKQVKFTEQPERLIVNALITTNERIDKAVPIDESFLTQEPNRE